MIKTISLLLLCFITWQVVAQTDDPNINIPDENFLNALIDDGVDTNGDGKIQQSEAKNVSELNVSENDINDLAGIESFVNLTILKCGNNSISELNISSLVNLEQLFCQSNNISTLDISKNTLLERFACENNNLSELSINGLTELFAFSCQNNQLTNLDIEFNSKLKKFDCRNNNMNLEYLLKINDKNLDFCKYSPQKSYSMSLSKKVTAGDAIDISEYVPKGDNLTAKWLNNYGTEYTSQFEKQKGWSYRALSDGKYSALVYHEELEKPIVIITDIDIIPSDNIVFIDPKLDAALAKNKAIDTDNNGKISLTEAKEYSGDIDISEEEISCINELALFTKARSINCSNNKLDFNDLDKLTPLAETCAITYAPQQLYSIDKALKTGIHYDDVFEFEGGISYIWYDQNSHQLEQSSTEEDAIEFSNEGIYYCIVSCDRWPDLKLKTENISVEKANYLNIPDENFKNALIENDLIDTNNDDQIQFSEALAVTDLYVENMNISNMSGIEHFTNLIYLNCDYNAITTLDISQNKKLESLRCSSNRIIELDVSNNSRLKKIYCGFNLIRDIDLSNNKQLIHINLYDNRLQNIETSNLTELIYLNCGNNVLEEIDISQNSELKELRVAYSNLKTIDLTHNYKLREISCSGNKLTDIDLSNCPELEEIDCYRNKLKKLDISNNLKLNKVSCKDNYLSLDNLQEITERNITNADLTPQNLDTEEYYFVGETIDLSYLILTQGETTFEWKVKYYDVDIAEYIKEIEPGKFEFIARGSLTCKIKNSGELTYKTDDLYVDEDGDKELWLSSKLKNALLENEGIDQNGDGKISKREARKYDGEIDISNRGIDDINNLDSFTHCTSIDCRNNNLHFDELYDIISLHDKRIVKYAPQNVSQIRDKHTTQVYYSYLYSGRDGSEYYQWYDEDGVAVEFPTNESYDMSFDRDGRFYCMITNDYWPELTLKTTTTEVLADRDLSFVDQNFEKALIENDQIDTNSDNKIQLSEAYRTKWLPINSKNISNLSGIENFHYLEFLDCSNNDIRTIDISNNKLLKELNITTNKLTELNIESNNLINEIRCANNKLPISAIFKLKKAGLDRFDYSYQNIDFGGTFYTDEIVDFNEIITPDSKFTFRWVESVWTCNDAFEKMGNGRYKALKPGSYNCYISHEELQADIYKTQLINIYKNEEIDFADAKLKEQLLAIEGIDKDSDGKIYLKEAVLFNGDIDISNQGINDLSGLSHFNKAIAIDCSNNRLDFSDLENIGYNGTIIYSPQQKVIIEKESIKNQTKESILPPKELNTYLWHYRAEETAEWQPVKEDEVTFSKIGQYYCTITNSNWPDLTLSTTAIQVIEDRVLNFVDQNFKKALIEDDQIDTNNDDQIQLSEAWSVSYLDLSDKNILALSEIEHFINLTYLDCRKNEISTIDISKCEKLETLDISYNKLTEFEGQANLTKLYCYNNEISTIDISKCQKLETLNVSSNKLTKFVGQANLTNLYCYNNEISTIDISKCKKLETLDVSSNKLTEFEGQVNITDLDCRNNEISTIDISMYEKLEILDIASNKLTEFEGQANLTHLYCYNNQISTIDISKCKKLETLNVSNNKLTKFEGQANLTKLYCRYNEINTIDISKCEKLQTLDISYNKLTKFEGQANLTDLNCRYNEINTIDISKCEKLETLDVSNNKLTKFEGQANLTDLDCNDNEISTIDISMCEKLETLDVSNNKLTGFEGQAGLTNINCSNNEISTIDISKCEKLKILDVSHNELTGLNIEKNEAIENVLCKENRLTIEQVLELNSADISYLSYSPQKLDFTSQLLVGDILDFTKSIAVDKKITFSWHDKWKQNDKLFEKVENGKYKAKEVGTYSCKISHEDLKDAVYIITPINVLKDDNIEFSKSNLKERLLTIEGLDKNGDGEIHAREAIAFAGDIDISSLNLKQIPELTYFTNAASIDCSDNNLDFSDLQYLKTDGKIVYAPQREYDIARRILINSEEWISMPTGKSKRYQWYTQSGEVAEGLSTKSHNVVFNEKGYYYCEITDSNWPELTLRTTSIRVIEDYTIEIPDENFKKALTDNPKIDVNKDGEIQWSEANGVTQLNIESQKIKSLEGIYNFANLKILNCSNNLLSKIEVDELSHLEVLYCDHNKIRKMEIAWCDQLYKIDCSYNQIELLFLTLDNLKELYCSNNRMTVFQTEYLPKLIHLDIRQNRLVELEFGEVNRINVIRADYNQLREADFSNCHRFFAAYLTHNKLTFSKVRMNNEIDYKIDLRNQKKMHIPIQACVGDTCDLSAEITPWNDGVRFEWKTGTEGVIETVEPGIFVFQVEGNYNCVISYKGNYIVTTDIKVTNDVNIEFKDEKFKQALIAQKVDKNEDGEISFEEANEFQYVINVNDMGITDLSGIEHFTKIQMLYCSNNNLKSLDLSNNKMLRTLDCSNNQIVSIDLGDNRWIWDLNCANNQLSKIDLSHLTSLNNLNISGNDISELNVATYLLELDCSHNRLPFSQLEIRKEFKMTKFNYNDQVEIPIIDKLITTNQLDLSSEYYIYGAETEFVWFNENGSSVDGSLLTVNDNGIFQFGEKGRYYCQMSNSKLPGLILKTTIIEIIDDYVVDIRDSNFRDYLLNDNNSVTYTFNKNGDSQIQYSEICKVEKLDISNKGISSLIGIENFISLKELNCSDNFLQNINISKNRYLETLNCSNNRLSSLDLRANNHITTLDCSGNNIEEVQMEMRGNTDLDYDFGANQLLFSKMRQLPSSAYTGLNEKNINLMGIELGSIVDLAEEAELFGHKSRFEWSCTGARMPIEMCIEEVEPGKFKIKQPGSFECVITNSKSRHSQITVTLNEIEFPIDEPITVYPNPARDNINVYKTRPECEKVEIFNFRGHLVKSVLKDGRIINIDISDLKQGMYIIRVEDRITRFIKK